MDKDLIQKQIDSGGYASLTTDQKNFYNSSSSFDNYRNTGTSDPRAVDIIQNATGGSGNPYEAYNPNAPITGDDLGSTATPPFESAPQEETPPVITNVPVIEEAKLGPGEQFSQDLIADLINDTSLDGKTAYQQEQEAAQGIPGLEKQQKELLAQLTGLSNEAKAIPLQIEQEFQGKGATAAGVAPHQAARLRENAIKAFSVNSLLASTQGAISTAQDFADRAVSAKYGPLEAARARKIRNLELLLKSPQLTLEQEKRAQAQLLIQKREEAKLASQKENFSTAQAMASAAVKNNPGNQAALFAAQQIQKLDPSKPDYLEKVFQLVGQYQSDPAQIQKDILDQKYKQAQIDAIEADTSLTPLKKAKLEQEIAESEANQAKINAEITAMNNPSILRTANGKPLTDAQATALGFAQRVGNSMQVINEIGSQFVGVSSYLGGMQPNALKSSDRQRFEQSQRDFINAVLRRESGAVISEQEFKNARLQYFPQPGDGIAVQEQKRRNRFQVYQNLLTSAGNPNLDDQDDAESDTQVVGGITYVKGSDGLYYPK